MSSIASTSVLPTPPSLLHKLLLSQAVLQHGAQTDKWALISDLVSTRFGGVASDWSPTVCRDLYEGLMRQGSLDIAKTREPNSRTARKLVRLLHDARKAALVLSLKQNLLQTTILEREILTINSGTLDNDLISSLPLQIRETIFSNDINHSTALTTEPFVTHSSTAPLIIPSLPLLPKLDSSPMKMEVEVEVQGVERVAEEGSEGVRKSARKGRTSNSTLEQGSDPDDDADDGEESASASFLTPELLDEFTTVSPSLPSASTSTSRREKKGPTQPPIKPRASGRKVRKTIEATEAEEGEGLDYTSQEEEEMVVDGGRKGKGKMVGEDEGDEEEDGEDGVEDGEDGVEDGEGGKRGRGKGKKVVGAGVKKGRKRKSTEPLDENKKQRSKTDETPEAEEERDLLARNQRFKRGMNGVMKQLTDYPNAAAFLGPVRPSDAPSYPTAVKRSMSLREVSNKVRSGGITSAGEVQRDVALICANAVMFNDPELDVVRHARELWGYFEAQLQLFLATHQE